MRCSFLAGYSMTTNGSRENRQLIQSDLTPPLVLRPRRPRRLVAVDQEHELHGCLPSPGLHVAESNRARPATSDAVGVCGGSPRGNSYRARVRGSCRLLSRVCLMNETR